MTNSTLSSIRVAGRMLLMPCPRGGDDVFELRILRLPTEFGIGLGGGGDEFGRIARATRLLDRWNLHAGDLFAHLDDFLHGVTVAVAEVVETSLARREAEDVRLREIHDVDVIADARAVRGRIIRAVNLALLR